MVDGTYEFLVGTPLGEKRGTATLTTDGTALTADVRVSGMPRQRGVGTCDGNAFTAAGSVKIPFMGSFDYRIEGSVQGDVLDAVCATDRGSLRVTGLRR